MIHRKLLPPNPPLLFIRASSVLASTDPPWDPGNTNVFSSDIIIKFFRSHDIVTTEAKLSVSKRQTYHYRKKRYALNNQAGTRNDITKTGRMHSCTLPVFMTIEVSIPAYIHLLAGFPGNKCVAKINKRSDI